MSWLNQSPTLTWGELLVSLFAGVALALFINAFILEPLFKAWRKRKADAAARHQEMLRLIDKAVQEAMKKTFPQVGAHAQYTPWDDDASKQGKW